MDILGTGAYWLILIPIYLCFKPSILTVKMVSNPPPYVTYKCLSVSVGGGESFPKYAYQGSMGECKAVGVRYPRKAECQEGPRSRA